MPSFRRKLWKWIAGAFAVMTILLALGLGLFRLVLAQVPDYRAQIQSFISERARLDIEFSGLDARWRIYGPELVFEDAVVRAPNGTRTLVRARRGSVAFDIWESLATGRITTGRFWFDGPEIVLVRTREGRIELVGQDELPERTEPFLFDDLPTGLFSVSDARVTFRDLASGREPWTFARVAVTLQRRAASMQLRGTAELPSALGRQLEFSAETAGQLDDPQVLHWNFSVGSRELALAGLADVLPETWPAPAAGVGSFRLTGLLRGARIEALSGDVTLAGLALPLPGWQMPLPGPDPLLPRADPAMAAAGTPGQTDSEPDPAPPPQAALPAASPPERIDYDVVRSSFAMERTSDGGWHLSLDGLQLVRPGVRWDPSRVEIDVDGREGGGFGVRGTAEFLSLDGVWPLLAYLPQTESMARVRALAAAGRLRDLNFSYSRPSPETAAAYSISGRFEDVAFAPVTRTPGLAGLTGAFKANDGGGQLELAARRFRFTLPRLFRDPIELDAVDGVFTWQRGADRWRVASGGIALRDADGSGRATFALELPDDGSSPLLEFAATGSDIDARAASRYLPAARLTPRALAWLDRAFVAGRLSSATVEYRGPTRRFPFRGNEGLFVASARFTGITLDYDRNWLPATELAGEVEFRNQGVTARADSGRVAGLVLAQATARIADFRSTEIDLRASGSGDLGAALGYLQRSSAGPLLGNQFMALEGRGATTFDVSLWLPVRQMRNRRVDVTARLANAELGQRGRSQRITALNGPLRVLDRTVLSEGLEGRFLGGPVSLRLVAETGAAGESPATVLTANGRATVRPLRELLGLPDVVRLTGGAAWRMLARFVPPPPRPPGGGNDAAVRGLAQTYVIESDLRGLGIGLPAPLEKPAATAQPLHVEIETDGGTTLLARGSLGTLRSVVRLQRERDEWSFDRAGIRADGLAASVPGHAGIRIEGDVESFVLDDWLRLRTGGAAPGNGRRVGDLLQAANVRIGSFGLFGYVWRDVRGLLQSTPSGWQIDVSGPDATGKLQVPFDLAGAAPMTLEMERLVLAGRTGAAGSRSTTDPRQVPPITARINDFVLGNRRLGSVRLDLKRIADGLDIASATAQGEAFNLEASGSWRSQDDVPGAPRRVTTTIAGAMTSSDVRTTLRALGYGDFVAGRRGLLQADLRWPGGPDADAIGRATGTVRIEIDNGQVLDLQPGAGRMLGLLSVAALPRRLSLDFSDLTDEGLSFDAVRGDFELRSGDAFTSNLLLTGPAAEIGIAGRTGLGSRDYDQTAVVTGNLGATLPVAGALAGGPVVGAAMLLFSQVFKEPLKGITRGYYRITGSWDSPQVERVVASDAKEAAASVPQQAAPAATPPGSPASP